MMNKKMVFAIAGLLVLPMAAAASTLEEQQVVTGHAMYADMSGFDEDIAAIAGYAESRVVWFNGQSIMNTVQEGFIYGVESGANCSPLQGDNFTFQDYTLSFIDPNNQSHIVGHYTYECPPSPLADTEDFLLEPLFGIPTYNVWITPTHELISDAPIVAEGDAGRLYNFALAVDTSFMEQEETSHSGEGGRTTSELGSGDAYCPEEDAHHCGDGSGNEEHTHNTALVDLYYSANDRGIDAATEEGGAHPGTVDGCDDDDHCVSVRDGSWEDPSSST